MQKLHELFLLHNDIVQQEGSEMVATVLNLLQIPDISRDEQL